MVLVTHPQPPPLSLPWAFPLHTCLIGNCWLSLSEKKSRLVFTMYPQWCTVGTQTPDELMKLRSFRLDKNARSWAFPGGPAVKTLHLHHGVLVSIPGGVTRVPHATWHSQQKACSSQVFSPGDKAGTQHPSSHGGSPTLQRWAGGVGAGTRLSQGSPASWVSSQSF